MGPAFVGLSVFERTAGACMRFLQVFGRVPLFFYVVHIYLLHTGSRLLFWWSEGEPVLLLRAELSPLGRFGLADIDWQPLPEGFQALSLPAAYGVTAACLVVLYPLCRWFGQVKQHSSSVWLSYL